MAALVRALERFLGFGQLVLAGEQNRQLERSHRIPALVGAPVGSRGTRKVAALLEEHPELSRRLGMAALVCACEGFFGFGQPVLLSEYDGEFERLVAVTALVGGTIGDQGISQVPPPIRGPATA